MNPARQNVIHARGFLKVINLALTRNATDHFNRIFASLTEVREHLKGSDWSDKYRVMPQSSRYRRWDTNRTPYLRQISDFLSDNDPAHQVVILGKAAQMGGSEVALNEVLRRIHLDPCSILYYMESQDKVSSWMSERLDPALAREPFSTRKFRKSAAHREYAGGALICNGVGSSASLSSITAKFIVGDEVARYPTTIGGEGDFLSLARQRCVTFGDDGKIFLVSTFIDAVRGEGTFTEYYESGDKREYNCPCKECGEFYLWGMEHFRVIDGDPIMVCPHCGGMTHDGDERADAIIHGKWIPTQEPKQNDTVSYRLSGFVAPSSWRPWIQIHENYTTALRGAASLQSVHNLVLGLPFNEPTARVPEPGTVAALMMEPAWHKETLPDGVRVLTMAVDVQKDRLVVEVKGWGEHLENWSILHTSIRCSIAHVNECVRALKAVMSRRFQFSDGSSLSVKLGCIDEGYRATEVHQVADKFPQPTTFRGGYAYIPVGCLTPTKGASMRVTDRLLMGEPGGKTARGLRRKLKFWRLGTDVAKRELYMALNLMQDIKDGDEVDAIFCKPHAPLERDEDYFKELVAEQVVTRRNKETGKLERIFYLPPRVANEALDLHVMNRAAADILRLPELQQKDWDRLRDQVHAKIPDEDRKSNAVIRKERRAEMKQQREARRRQR